MKNLLLITFLLVSGMSFQTELSAKGANESSAVATLRAVVVSANAGGAVWVVYSDGRIKTTAQINNVGNRTFRVGEIVTVLVVTPKDKKKKKGPTGHVTVLR